MSVDTTETSLVPRAPDRVALDGGAARSESGGEEANSGLAGGLSHGKSPTVGPDFPGPAGQDGGAHHAVHRRDVHFLCAAASAAAAVPADAGAATGGSREKASRVPSARGGGARRVAARALFRCYRVFRPS